MRGELPCRARSARRNTRPRPGLLRTHGTPSLCRYLTRPRTPPAAATVPGCCERAVCRNRRKSKWRNRRGRPRHPGAARRYRLLLLAAACEGWPSSRSGSRNVKMVDGSQLNRKIPFLQHLGSIVWARRSVFWVTAEWKCYLPPRKLPSLWFSCCIDTHSPTNYRNCHNHCWGPTITNCCQ